MTDIFKGNDKTWEVTVKDVTGTIANISGCQIYFSAKDRMDSPAVIYKSISGDQATGIEFVDDGVSGLFRLNLIPADTSGLIAGDYHYDFKLVSGTKTYTILQDILVIRDVVTT